MQTCIVNVDKRHAFVKMISRSDAVTAKEGMERYKSAEMQLRVSLSSLFSSLPRDSCRAFDAVPVLTYII